MIRAGQLEHRVKLWGRTLVTSTVGQEEGIPSLLASTFARVVEGAGREFLEAGEWTAEKRAVFTVRYREGLDTTLKVDWSGWRWNVEGVRIVGRREGLELMATNRGEVAP